jgi:SagB-type dehydrogenase family enzyme
VDVADDPGTLQYVRAAHLAMEWTREGLVIANGVTGRRYAVSAAIVETLDKASKPASLDEIARAADQPLPFVRQLRDRDLIVPVAQNVAGNANSGWSTFELLVQRMTGVGHARTRKDWSRMPSPVKPRPRTTLTFPHAEAAVTASFVDVLGSRRSTRAYALQPLDGVALGELLRMAVRAYVVDHAHGTSLRPYPSGGGRHPLEVYVLAYHVDALPAGVYHYDPEADDLAPMDEVASDRLDEIRAELGIYTGTPGISPVAVLLITAVFARTMWKYARMGLSLIYRDVGCLLQTLHLSATALGLAGCAVAGGREMTNARWLGLDPVEESQVGCFLLGKPVVR